MATHQSPPTDLDTKGSSSGEFEGSAAVATLHSGAVPFEAYLHFARIQRQRDDAAVQEVAAQPSRLNRIMHFGKEKKRDDGAVTASVHPVAEAEKGGHAYPPAVPDEAAAAQRGIRVATWINIFYLITTDILGPTSAPWAFSQLGFASGVLLFFFMGAAAAYTGFLIWHMYLKLDSDEYPVKTYSDLADRIFGRWARHSVNALQTLQLLFNVAVIILGNSQGLSQVSKGRVCFSVLAVIWTIAGMLIGQIRSIQNYGGLANLAIWMNLLVIFITMGAVSHSAPNFAAAKQQNPDFVMGPVATHAMISQSFKPQVVGVMQIVYSYGGAMLFVEFMAEMRRPFDFWKGMICAQAVIFTCYMLYGAFVYSFQGQFTINPANQGISGFGLQTATNIISLLSALIAAGLYGNIGIKVIYSNIVQGVFNGPPMLSRAGRILWVVIVPCYWALAFVVASAIPQFSNISGIVAAICILQFTYTFPPILHAGFMVQYDAVKGDNEYTPGATTGQTRVDTWRSWSRWKRGYGGHWWLNTFNIIMCLAAAATAGLGTFSSVEGIIAGFAAVGAATSFGCTPPV